MTVCLGQCLLEAWDMRFFLQHADSARLPRVLWLLLIWARVAEVPGFNISPGCLLAQQAGVIALS